MRSSSTTKSSILWRQKCHLKNCLANESASLNMACSDESLKHSELALLEAELS